MVYTFTYKVLQCVTMCCSVLQCVAVCCSVLQRVNMVYTFTSERMFVYKCLGTYMYVCMYGARNYHGASLKFSKVSSLLNVL